MSREKTSLFKRCIGTLLTLVMIFSLSIVSFAAVPAEELKQTVIRVYNDAATTDDQKQEILDLLRVGEDGTTVATDQQVTISIGGETFIYSANGAAATDTNGKVERIYTNNHAGDHATGVNDPAVAAGITEIGNNFRVSADVAGATKSLEGFLPLIRGLTGILAVITILGLGVFTAFDVVYLAFPVAKGKMDAAAQSGAAQGGSMVTGKNHQTGEAKFRLVTDDAQAAYNEAAQAGKQPWIPYIKRRWVTYVLCAVIIYILLSGNMAIFINWALSAISGLLDTLSHYA